MTEINRFLAKLVEPRNPAAIVLHMFDEDLAFESTFFNQPGDPSFVRSRFIDLGDCCVVQFFVHGNSDVMVASEDAPFVDIDWTLYGNAKPKEANPKNMWKLFQISYPSNRRIVFRAICNNEAFVDKARPDTSGYLFASTPGDSTHRSDHRSAYMLSFSEAGAKEFFPQYNLPLHSEECWVSLKV